ncbi:CD9 antigen [Octopus bimaculoides]|uniref:Tetraspanin n=1 Tax=Octopus bimaculoides TaxID=37653 RepID=A0A0L8I230_OCTBM|nr:CD9 antigen [Octopus bimaculoides]|eukprot:XP_014767493.1 PREDICTED: CD9 antigen-like [Octopus bimaculoides]
MAVGCSENCMKYILFFFNLIIFILGIAGVALGSILLAKKDLIMKGLDGIQMEDVLDGFSNDTIKAGAIVLIIASVVVVLIAFFGCFGAWKESSCLLGTYSTIMAVILTLQVAVFIMIIVARPKFEETIKESLQKLFDKSKSKEQKEIVERLFNENECCGIEKPSDVDKYNFVCKNKSWPGCYTKVKESISKNLPAAIGIAIAIILVQLFLIVFACCLCTSKRGETLS